MDILKCDTKTNEIVRQAGSKVKWMNILNLTRKKRKEYFFYLKK